MYMTSYARVKLKSSILVLSILLYDYIFDEFPNWIVVIILAVVVYTSDVIYYIFKK